MSVQKVCHGYSFWFDRERKSIGLTYHLNRLLHPSLWLWWRNNGAIKGKDSCYDFNMEILGLHFSYTNWAYNRKEDTK